MKLVLESTVEAISTRTDGTVSIKIGTQELDPSNAALLFGFRGKYVKVLLSDTNITNLESETIDAAQLVGVKKNKTESQRLRAVLFRIHEQLAPDIDFETYYKMEMEKVITHYKSKLD